MNGHDCELDSRYRCALIYWVIDNFPVPVKHGSIRYALSWEDVDLPLEATESAQKGLK